MSTFKIERLPDEPIAITTEFETFSLAHDGKRFGEALAAFFANEPSITRLIIDSRLPKYNMDDVVSGVNNMMIPYIKQLNLEKIVVIGLDEIKRLITQGVASTPFGNMPAVFCSSMEEALAEARLE